MFNPENSNVNSTTKFLEYVKTNYTREQIETLINDIHYRYFLIDVWNDFSNRLENGGIKKNWVTIDGREKNIDVVRSKFKLIKDTIDKFRANPDCVDDMAEEEKLILGNYLGSLNCFGDLKLIKNLNNHYSYLKNSREQDAREESIFRFYDMIENLQKEKIPNVVKSFFYNDAKQYINDKFNEEVNNRKKNYALVDAIMAQMRNISMKNINESYAYQQDVKSKNNVDEVGNSENQ